MEKGLQILIELIKIAIDILLVLISSDIEGRSEGQYIEVLFRIMATITIANFPPLGKCRSVVSQEIMSLFFLA